VGQKSPLIIVRPKERNNMMDPKLLAVIVGVFGALLGVYFKECIGIARQKISVAVMLESTLIYWFDLFLQNKTFTDILIKGTVLQEKEKEILSSGNIEELYKYRESIKDSFSKAEDEFLNEQKQAITELAQNFSNMSEQEYDEILKEISEFRKNIKDMNGFLNNERLSVLDCSKLPKIIALQINIDDFICEYKFSLIHLHTNENPDMEKICKSFFKAIIKMIDASKDLVPLIEYTRNIRQKGLLGNIF